jgi:O-antigen chain-terminating methyltransferase
LDDAGDLEGLRRQLEEHEKAYAALLDALDGLASFRLPAEELPEMHLQMERLNELWERALPPVSRGLSWGLPRIVWNVMEPALDHQRDFNSVLVQILNGYFDESARLHAHLREVVSTLVRYLQRVLPLVDARDRMATGLATTRAELVLEAFDRRQESLARRIEGLTALRDRLEAVSAEVRGLRETLAAGAPPPVVAAAAVRAAEDSGYAAFENRFRAGPEELRDHLASYVALFEGLAPVADLGCGRGEFLELLKARGIAARGVEASAHAAAQCRARGLDVVEGDLVDFLRSQPDASLGGAFAAQVAEHLPPAALQALLREAHRVLRPGGLLALETVNPRSVVGLLEVFNRDLTHQKPLHPDTLSFLAAAAGFTDVRVELRSPVEPAARLQPVPAEGLPSRAAEVINENVTRLNDLLYAPQEYVLLARR